DVGNQVSITHPEGNGRINAYDGLNRLTMVVDDPTGPIGTMAALDPRFTRTNGLHLTTRYDYDENNNVTDQYDSKDNHVETTYDVLNRKTSQIQHKPGGNLVTQYTDYDGEGNLLAMIDPEGRQYTYTYDNLNRQVVSYYPDIDSPYMEPVQINTGYDANNNVTNLTETKTDETGTTLTDTTINTYDAFDRLDTTTQRGLAIDYDYDLNGNRTLVSTTTGSTVYAYDDRNRLEITTVDTAVTNYTYTPNGKPDTITHPTGAWVKYTYTAADRIETITHRAVDSSLISSYSYTYDENGNRLTQIETQNGATETTTYTYNALDQLTDFTLTDGSDTTITAYTYDHYNRRTEIVTENGSELKNQTYTYDETHWLTTIDDHKNSSTITYNYDNNGNTILKSSSLTNENTLFAYNNRDQLVQVARGPPGSEVGQGKYDYNAAGMRIRHLGSERGDVEYFYDGTSVLEERDIGSDTLLAHYRYADRLLSLYDGTGTQYYHHDALGSTVNLSDDSGQVQVSYNLDPWGHIRNQTGTTLNRQIFTGQEHDLNTGLIYFGARYYDPDIGRFITQDTYLGEPGVPPSLHRYLYAYSNPLVYVDPNGNIAILKNGADALSDFNSWLSDRTDMYGEGKLAIAGAIATGVTRAIVAASEGGLRATNYAANLASGQIARELGVEDAAWAQAHAQEVADTHKSVADAVTYLAQGGTAEIYEKAIDTVQRAAQGDASAIGDLTEFAGGFALGGGGAASGTVKAANATRVMAQGTKQVIKKSTEQITRIVPKITGELKKGMHQAGQKVLAQVDNNVGAVGPGTRKAIHNQRLRKQGKGDLDDASKSGDDWAKLSGQLRDASKGKGNFGIGSGTREQADAMGKAWVGEGYTVASDGKTLVSADKLKQYRPPSNKPKLGKTQANFEQRFPGQKSKQWQSNAHLDIVD
ncbi:MAG: hypothetical protein GY845_13610, partial [Planctomycetes bacterium]|nr:hypothetical protein [Planctomycetota bacterium]